MTLCRYGGRHYSKKHIGCCGSGLAASMGESATAIGSGRAVFPMPASSRRPKPTARSGSWPGPGGTRAARASLTPSHRCKAVGSLGRPPRSLATRTVGSRLPSRPRPMGTARRPRAVTVHSESCRCREASRCHTACLPAVWQSAALGGRHAAWLRAPSALASPPDRGRWEPHVNLHPKP